MNFPYENRKAFKKQSGSDNPKLRSTTPSAKIICIRKAFSSPVRFDTIRLSFRKLIILHQENTNE